MGVEISNQVWGQSGEVCKFPFSGTVGASIVALSGFEVWWDDAADWPVKEFILSVGSPGSSGPWLSAQPTLQLNDGGDHRANPKSMAIMTALAWVGQNPAESVAWAARSGIVPPGDSLPPIPLSGDQLDVKACALTGFEFAYSENHNVQQLEVSCSQSVSTSDGTARLQCTAKLQDASGNIAEHRVVSAAFLGFEESALVCAPLPITVYDNADPDHQDPDHPNEGHWFDLGCQVTKAAVLLVGFDLQSTAALGDERLKQIVVRVQVDEVKGTQAKVSGYVNLEGRGDSTLYGSMTVLVVALKA